MRKVLTYYRPTAVLTIIKLNLAVFILWLFFDPRFMYLNFLVSWHGVLEGRLWTLVTSVFSHNYLFHLFINMFAFYGFGMAVESELGTRRFIFFYLASGVTASLGHCLVSNYLLHQPALPALGASGAVAAVILYFSLRFPRERILLLGLIPLPAISAAFLFIGLDVWGLIAQTQGGQLPIGHGAHLGGAFFGLCYFLKNRTKLSE